MSFPHFKFSVRLERYSGGSHVNISYVDGPPTKAVEAVVSPFYGRGFDGMTDSTTYHDSEIGGQRYRFAGSAPSVYRKLTGEDSRDSAETPRAKIEALLRAQWNPNTGSAWQDTNAFERASRIILSSMDLRWETYERAVAKYFAGGIQ